MKEILSTVKKFKEDMLRVCIDDIVEIVKSNGNVVNIPDDLIDAVAVNNTFDCNWLMYIISITYCENDGLVFWGALCDGEYLLIDPNEVEPWTISNFTSSDDLFMVHDAILCFAK